MSSLRRLTHSRGSTVIISEWRLGSGVSVAGRAFARGARFLRPRDGDDEEYDARSQEYAVRLLASQNGNERRDEDRMLAVAGNKTATLARVIPSPPRLRPRRPNAARAACARFIEPSRRSREVDDPCRRSGAAGNRAHVRRISMRRRGGRGARAAG